MAEDLLVLTKFYDLLLWLTPHIEKLPRSAKYTLGDRMQGNLYDVLESLIRAKYRKEKLAVLEECNISLEILRFHLRLLKDHDHFGLRRFEHAARLVNEVGGLLGNWVRQQQRKGQVET